MLGVCQWRHRAVCVSRQHRLCRRWLRGIFMYYWWKAVVFIHRLWNNVYYRWLTNNFPCKWHTSTKSGSKSSSTKIFHGNSRGARTPTKNSAWTTKEKTSTRNRLARPAKAKPTTKDRGTEEQETGISEALWSFYDCGKPTFNSLPVSPPIYRSKSAKFQLCTTARSIIIFMRTALPYLCFVFCFFFFSFLNPETEVMLTMLFNTQNRVSRGLLRDAYF